MRHKALLGASKSPAPSTNLEESGAVKSGCYSAKIGRVKCRALQSGDQSATQGTTERNPVQLKAWCHYPSKTFTSFKPGVKHTQWLRERTGTCILPEVGGRVMCPSSQRLCGPQPPQCSAGCKSESHTLSRIWIFPGKTCVKLRHGADRNGVEISDEGWDCWF